MRKQAAKSDVTGFVGLFCHRTATDADMTRHGWNWQNQGYVVATEQGIALIQFFSCIDGGPTHIEAIPITDMLNGAWRFYDSEEAWREAGDEAMARNRI